MIVTGWRSPGLIVSEFSRHVTVGIQEAENNMMLPLFLFLGKFFF